MKPQIKFLLGGAVIAGAFGALLLSSTESGTLRAVPVSDLRKADGTTRSFVGQRLRAVGFVTRDPVKKIARRDAQGIVNVNYFAVDDKGAQIHVQFAEVLPNSFRLGGPVQIDGTYTAPGELHADRVLTKCPSKYDADAKAQDGYRKKGDMQSAPEAPSSNLTAARATNARGS